MIRSGRHSATRSALTRRDVIIVASVSCIYGLGSPEAYYGMLLPLERGIRVERDWILRHADVDTLRVAARFLNHDYLARLEDAAPGLAEQGGALGRLESFPEAENVRLPMRREAAPQNLHITHASGNVASHRQPPPG